MADRMADGTTTYKFDQKAESSVVSGFASLTNRFDEYTRQQKAEKDEFNRKLEDGIGKMKAGLVERDNKIYSKVRTNHLDDFTSIGLISAVLTPILLSWIMRFLNFFFRWYILDIRFNEDDIPWVRVTPKGNYRVTTVFYTEDVERLYDSAMSKYRDELKKLRKTKRIRNYHELIVNTMNKHQEEFDSHIKQTMSNGI